jgi:hypothetical protein
MILPPITVEIAILESFDLLGFFGGSTSTSPNLYEPSLDFISILERISSDTGCLSEPSIEGYGSAAT